jgi:MFS family permease
VKATHSAGLVIAAGVVAALHVGKLPPAVPILQQALGVSLLQAGFLLSLVQLAGMLLGLPAALLIPRFGARSVMLTGLLVLSMASAAGGMAEDATVLLITRALEGVGFLCVVLPAPGLLRTLLPPGRLNLALGAWGAYMPLGAALALLIGPWAMMGVGVPWGWRVWWWGLSALSALLALLVFLGVPAFRLSSLEGSLRSSPGMQMKRSVASIGLVSLTLRSRAVWLVALCFAMYSGQWLAVVGFLPAIYAQAGLAAGATAWLTAVVAGVNIIGNLSAGRMLQANRPAVALLAAGFVAMAVGALVAFGINATFPIRYGAVLLFSMFGGLIPGTLFSLAVRLAPSTTTVPTSVGWMQQWSAIGQFCGPPLVALVANQTGSWRLTWLVTGGFSIAGLALAWQIRNAEKHVADGLS